MGFLKENPNSLKKVKPLKNLQTVVFMISKLDIEWQGGPEDWNST
jgi:hypothetical protein